MEFQGHWLRTAGPAARPSWVSRSCHSRVRAADYGVRRLGAARAPVFINLVPVFAVALGAVAMARSK